MKKTILIVLLLTNGTASMSLAVEDTWTTRTPMPTATSLHSASVVDGKIYVIGGTDNLFGWADYWSSVIVYDPVTDTWTRKADMPTGRARLSTSMVDGKILPSVAHHIGTQKFRPLKYMIRSPISGQARPICRGRGTGIQAAW